MDLNDLEKDLLLKDNLIYGIDEVGRSCIAGPMGFALVCFDKSILDHRIGFYQIKDSKVLSEPDRLAASLFIAKACKNYIIVLPNCEKDLREPYLNGLKVISEIALDKSNYIFVDQGIKRYMPAGFDNIHEEIKGDSKFFSIASASIMAKVYRDAIMRDLHNKFTKYDWSSNVGYPTPKHWKAINEHGLTKHHRTFFRKVAEYISK